MWHPPLHTVNLDTVTCRLPSPSPTRCPRCLCSPCDGLSSRCGPYPLPALQDLRGHQQSLSVGRSYTAHLEWDLWKFAKWRGDDGKRKGPTSWVLFIPIKITIDATRIRQRAPDGGDRRPGEALWMTRDLHLGQVQIEACRSPSAQTWTKKGTAMTNSFRTDRHDLDPSLHDCALLQHPSAVHHYGCA